MVSNRQGIFLKLLTANTMKVQANLDLRKPIFPFLNRIIFGLRNIYVLSIKNGRPNICQLRSFLNRDFTVCIYFLNLNQIYFEIVTFKKRKRKNLTLPTLNSMNCFSQFLQSRFSRVVIFGGVAVVLRAADFLAMFTLG